VFLLIASVQKNRRKKWWILRLLVPDAKIALMQLEATISKISDFTEIAKSGVLMTPALIVNGKIMIQGKLPSEGIIKNYLLEAIRS
jgi:hypothetical protein